MARILETRLKSRFDDATSGLTQALFGALYSLQEHIPVRRVARAPAEQLGKMVRAHAGNRSQLRETEIVRQVGCNMIKHTPETTSGQAASVGYRRVAMYGVAIEQIVSWGIGDMCNGHSSLQ